MFKYVLLFFGFCNSLASFQHYINDILYKYLDIFCMVDLDDILIYSNSLDKYKRHVKIILECLKSISTFLDIRNYEFYITEVPYLEFIISTHDVKIDSVKIKTILE